VLLSSSSDAGISDSWCKDVSTSSLSALSLFWPGPVCNSALFSPSSVVLILSTLPILTLSSSGFSNRDKALQSLSASLVLTSPSLLLCEMFPATSSLSELRSFSPKSSQSAMHWSPPPDIPTSVSFVWCNSLASGPGDDAREISSIFSTRSLLTSEAVVLLSSSSDAGISDSWCKDVSTSSLSALSLFWPGPVCNSALFSPSSVVLILSTLPILTLSSSGFSNRDKALQSLSASLVLTSPSLLLHDIASGKMTDPSTDPSNEVAEREPESSSASSSPILLLSSESFDKSARYTDNPSNSVSLSWASERTISAVIVPSSKWNATPWGPEATNSTSFKGIATLSSIASDPTGEMKKDWISSS